MTLTRRNGILTIDLFDDNPKIVLNVAIFPIF